MTGIGELSARWTPRAKKVLELSLREALSLGTNEIGTEHILLALIRENEGVAASVLATLDCDHERVRNEVIRQLSRQKQAGETDEEQIRRIVREELERRGIEPSPS